MDRPGDPYTGLLFHCSPTPTLAPVGFLETDPKGDFTFRSVPFNEELMLAVEADGFTKATVPGLTVRPSYSLVATVRLSREAAKP